MYFPSDHILRHQLRLCALVRIHSLYPEAEKLNHVDMSHWYVPTTGNLVSSFSQMLKLRLFVCKWTAIHPTS